MQSTFMNMTAYPNSYPLNIDYWIHIKAPERTRVIVQFQKIDLEPQDECLYDFVSIQNYELVSKIFLEPGTNPIPMAMLTSDSETFESDDDMLQYNNDRRNNIMRYALRRSGRSTSVISSQISDKVSRKKQKAEDDNDESLMVAQSEMQMISLSVERQNGKAYSSSYSLASTRSSHKTLSQLYSNDDNDITGSYSNALRLNPKHQRRKNSKDIANKLQKDSSSSTYHRHLQQQHPRYHDINGFSSTKPPPEQRRKRSTIRATIPSADNAQSFLPYVRWCGSHDSNMSKFDFVSSSNEVVFNFHSDYSVSGLGFAAIWKAIDISGCPVQTLTSREGTVVSPNYPHFMLNNINCAYVIQAPIGRRVWLEFIEYDLMVDSLLEVDIGNGPFRPFRIREHVNEGVFVSLKEQLRLLYRTGQHPRGRGFQAVYHTGLDRLVKCVDLFN